MRRLIAYFLSVLIPSAAGGSELLSHCRMIQHAGAQYTVCSFDPRVDDIRMFHRDRLSGEAYQSFANLSAALWRQHLFIVFAMNGGMYHNDLSPVGLLVEHGRETAPINIAEGWGNFFLLPNGVFFVEGSKAGVLQTSAYLNANIKPDFATQSGPMLVIDGEIHPRFLPDGESLKKRNGVGISRDGKVYFAISEQPVRFYDFATLFRDALQSPNALYLDGTISSVTIPDAQRTDTLFPMGPIIGVVQKVPF